MLLTHLKIAILPHFNVLIDISFSLPTIPNLSIVVMNIWVYFTPTLGDVFTLLSKTTILIVKPWFVSLIIGAILLLLWEMFSSI